MKVSARLFNRINQPIEVYDDAIDSNKEVLTDGIKAILEYHIGGTDKNN